MRVLVDPWSGRLQGNSIFPAGLESVKMSLCRSTQVVLILILVAFAVERQPSALYGLVNLKMKFELFVPRLVVSIA